MKRLFIIVLCLIFMFGGVSLANNSIDEVVSWMHQKELTIFDNPKDFMATQGLRRDEASKFFVKYAKEVLNLEPDTNKTSCNFNDLNQAWPDLKDVIKEACQLGLFQGHNGNFMPTQPLTNAQAITVLIRMIDGYKDETQGHFANKYFEKAQELGIMDGLSLNARENFDMLTTRGDVGKLIFNSSKLYSNSNVEENEKYYTVTRIIDGDTIEVSLGSTKEIVRLIGIDTPETVHTNKPIGCFGEEASNKVKELLLNKKILMTRDETQSDRDIYNRLLRYIHTEDGVLINERLVKNGYAIEYTYKTKYQYQSEFKEAEQHARNNQLGLWADNVCGNNNQPITNTPIMNYTFYTSNHHSAKLYYCETDSARKGLSPIYLRSYPSESELLKRYPSKTLNEPCK